MQPDFPGAGSGRHFSRQQSLSGHNAAFGLAVGWMFVLMVLAVVVSGCTGLLKPPEPDSTARAIVGNLIDEKGVAQGFKAIGDFRLVRKGHIRKLKLALAIQKPAMLRVEIITFLGQPIARIAARDGSIYFQDLGAGDNKVKRLRDRSLKRLLGIELLVGDLVAVLRGRLPEPELARKSIALMDPGSKAVLLKDSRHYLLARISWDRAKMLPVGYQRYRRDGKLLYEIRWAEWKMIDDRQIPVGWVFTDGNGNRLAVELKRIYLSEHMPAGMFILKNNH